MAVSFSGLASGLDTSSWVDAFVSVKQQDLTKVQQKLTTYQTTKSSLNDTRSAVSSLRTAIEKLTDAKFGGVFDLFGKSNAKSSNEDVFTATVTGDALRQNYDISIQQMATSTKVASTKAASSVADGTTKLKNIGISEGTVTAYVDGVKHTVNIGSDYNVSDLRSSFAGFGINIDIAEDGIVTFSSADPAKKIHISATTDSSNLASMLGLEVQEDGTYKSTNAIFKANVASKLTADDAGFSEKINAGTFVIGNATFTINENTTLSSLISDINASDEAQVYAFWDDATGKLNITSTREGASYINIEAGTSNFTDVMGLTESTWDEDGNLVSSRIFTDAQELGKNALFTINGTSMMSTSNTVTSDITRINGLTLNLKRANTEEDGVTTLEVSQDTSGLKDALENFVSAYNNCISKIDSVTASGADLHGETSLTSLKNTLRNYANGSNTTNGGIYKLLSEIGISTASADSNNLSTDTNALEFDMDKFTAALEANPESVKSILAGDNGIFKMMEDTVEQSLKAVSGFFDVKTSTLDSNIKKINEQITKQNTNITTYREQLQKKFSAMENMIAKMQQNYQSFLSA